jgi:YfiH family protein
VDGRFEERAGLRVLTFPLLDGRGVDAVVTTTAGGVSVGPYESLNLGLHVGDDPAAVVENRRRAAAAIGLGLDDLVFCNQTHGRMVVSVDAQDRGLGTTSTADAIDGTDALVTTTPGLGLVVMVADCVPIVLHHRGGAVAVVHAGWRGTVARVAEAAVEVLCATTGEGPEAIAVGIGPAIAADRYQVGPEVVAAARASLSEDEIDAAVRAEPDLEERWTFDLVTANARILTAAGVPADAIATAGHPTGDGTFFSDRTARPCGRFAVIARLATPAP